MQFFENVNSISCRELRRFSNDKQIYYFTVCNEGEVSNKIILKNLI